MTTASIGVGNIGKAVVDPSNPVAQDATAGSFGRFPTASPRALSSPGCSPPRLTS